MLTIRQIFKSSSKISGASVVGGLLTALANVVIARRLGPAELGIVGLTQLWVLYASFARPGVLSAGFREMLHLIGQGKIEEAERVEDVALTAEILSLALPVTAMALFAALHFQDPELRIAMLLAAGTSVATALFQFLDTIQWAYHRFSLIARVNLLQGLAQPLLALAGLFLLGLNGVLTAPILAALFAVGYLYWRTAAVRWRPAFDGALTWRLFKIGFPLSLNGLLYWGFRTSDRAMVAAWLDIKALGYFTFAMMFVTQACSLISDFLNVLQASLFSELGRLGRVRPLSYSLQKIALLILVLSGAAASASKTLIFPFMARFVPKFLPGVPVFEILVLNLVCTTAPLLANTVLTSAVVDRQSLCAVLQAVGLALNVAAGWLFLRHGWGLSGIAWSSALSQLTVAALAYGALHAHLFEGAKSSESARFYGWALGLVALTFGLHFALDLGPFAYRPESWVLPLVLRGSAAAVVWLCAGTATYLAWWNPEALPAVLRRRETANLL